MSYILFAIAAAQCLVNSGACSLSVIRELVHAIEDCALGRYDVAND